MPPSRKSAPATERVKQVLISNLQFIDRRLGIKDSHNFPDLVKLTEQRYKFVCDLELVNIALGADKDKTDATESLNRRISDLEFQLNQYKAKYGDVFGADSLDALTPNDPKSERSGVDSVPSA